VHARDNIAKQSTALTSGPFRRGAHQAVTRELDSPIAFRDAEVHYGITACEPCALAILLTQEGVESYR